MRFPSSVLSIQRALGLAVLALVLGCDEPPAPPRSWPPGTVFALDDRPITAAEIDGSADVLAQLEPDLVPTMLRRLALTNVVLPRVAGILSAGPKREAARAEAEEIQRLLAGGAALGGPLMNALATTRTGGPSDVGFEAWAWAAAAEIGRWSAPIETVGAYEVVRVDERTSAGSARMVRFKLSVYVIPYVDPIDPHAAIERALDRSKLEIVDPAWEEIVPETWKHRLRGGNRS